MPEFSDRLLWINGAPVDAVAGERFPTRNPATGEVLAEMALAGAEDVDRAVAAAQEGQRHWAAMSGTARGRVLQRTAELLRTHRQELAELECLDGGKPIAETPEADVDSGADCLEYFAGQASSLQGEYQEVDGGFFYTRPEPLGVCAGIGAWNYPLQIACWKSAPALAAGNAMIFKPAELTPLSAMRLAELFKEAGLPDGVFNVVHGFAETGRALVRHPGVAKVSLTGEAGTGKAVMRDAADTLKAVTMELGGKSPLIVWDDAALDDAVSGALLGNFYTQGEICTNGTRVFVHEDVLEDFLERLRVRTGRLKIGNPIEPDTDVGAMISPEHGEHVLVYIERGRSEGARLVAGGGRVEVPGCEGGCFVAPTIFADCRDDMTIVREEIFGPVMSVLSFRDEDEVIRRANATDYGLAAGVFTRDLNRAHRVVAALDAGTCWINHYNLTPIEMPFGGVKHSGIGRENSRHALTHYTRLKSVFVASGGVDAPY
ncbi:betaine-aldehyde dehydrogenase [Aquisalimonas lutea]|uniref:betaine-aldehyde dehydrogenase n=1 Tax=Aquisalimonas lutea TaxID=1327750 RepID=UPI0025B5EC8C|nr:betaine-aldehyde dehydrogenase [Aquisalimonas lutea]MDN3516735.1 betaine-aldehyde dehydrogenase [Aquisalimonas lutea]